MHPASFRHASQQVALRTGCPIDSSVFSMSEDFLPTPLQQLQRHDFPYWRSPFGVVHGHRCDYCFSCCQGWQGFHSTLEALGKRGKLCHLCNQLDGYIRAEGQTSRSVRKTKRNRH
ncbi:MAG TPA: hypothetical protein V6C65_42305 [Allocoleopsis sp.]